MFGGAELSRSFLEATAAAVLDAAAPAAVEAAVAVVEGDGESPREGRR